MSFWVHIEADGRPWCDAEQFSPPIPSPVPGKGFPTFHVEFDGFTFTFASLDELNVCLETLSKKLLPTSTQLSAKRGTSVGPNSHWLSRLPAKVKPWRYREKAVAYLAKAKVEFLAELSTC